MLIENCGSCLNGCSRVIHVIHQKDVVKVKLWNLGARLKPAGQQVSFFELGFGILDLATTSFHDKGVLKDRFMNKLGQEFCHRKGWEKPISENPCGTVGYGDNSRCGTKSQDKWRPVLPETVPNGLDMAFEFES